MGTFSVRFPSGYEMIVADARDAADAMALAFKGMSEPVYCLIHEEIRGLSSAAVGQLGFYYPRPVHPVSATLMRAYT